MRSSVNPQQTEIWTVMRLITWGAEYFKGRGVDSPRLTMELMLAHLLQLSRFELYVQFDRPLSEEHLAKLREMVRRRASREPLQYILGEAHFHGRRFEVTPSVLIPRPETELLVEEALRRVQPLRCLDVGAGSGCIGITIALERPSTEVVGIDNSEEALQVARSNATQLGAKNITFQHCDLFDHASTCALGSFDLVVSNPPYVPAGDIPGLEPEVRDFEPRGALTDRGDGLAFYRRFLELTPTLLRPDGSYMLEIGFGQDVVLAGLFQGAGFDVEIFSDLDKVPRILWAKAKGQ